MAEDCIFCKIVAEEIPSERIHEDAHTIGFMDVNPWVRGHALVIPRRHWRNLWEIDDEDLRHTAVAAKQVAIALRDRLGAEGVNLLNSCEPIAWQTIFHFHIHVLPRYSGDPLQLPGRPEESDPDQLAELATRLRG
jgi:histidine triad (HIT) family protein